MKYLFLLDVEQNIGGGDYSILKFAEALNQRGHDISIVHNRDVSDFIRPEQIDCISKPSFGYGFKGAGKVEKIMSWLFYQKLKGRLRNSHYDFVVGYLRKSAVASHRIKTEFGIPNIIFNFETPNWVAEYIEIDESKQAAFKSYYSAADLLLSNSYLCQKKCQEWLGKEISGFVYPGVDDAAVPGSWQSRPIDIIYIGRLTATKRVDLLIRSVAKFERPLSIDICGTGEKQAEYENLARQVMTRNSNVKIEFSGQITEETKWNKLSNAKVMVFPTQFEGFGIPPSEAIMALCKCICRRLPIFEEVYGNHLTYFDDEGQLPQLIEASLSSPFELEKAMQTKSLIKKKYTWANSAEKIENYCLNFQRESLTADAPPLSG